MKDIAIYRFVIAAWLFSGLAGLSPQAHAAGGTPVWTNRYDGPGNGSDFAYSLAADSNGNVFVTGSSWDGISDDLTAIKYSPAGGVLWTNRYNGPGNSTDVGYFVTLDTNGDLYVTGEERATNGYSDLVVLKYANNGTPIWTNHYNGPGNQNDIGSRVMVEHSGNVLVAGRSSNGTNDDYVIIQYSSAGVAQWTNHYNGPGDSTEWVSGLAEDQDGNVFVAGTSDGGDSYYDFALLAYSSTGTPLWTNRYTEAGFSDDACYGVTVDGAGNVFVAGYSRPSGQDAGFLLVKYSNTGVQLWTKRYASGNGDSYCYSMAMDSEGSVIITGPSYDGLTWDYVTVKYSNAGAALWTNRYDGPAHGHDYSEAVCVDSAGNVFVTGYSGHDSGNTSFDYATVAYSSTGMPMWTNRLEGPGNDNEAFAIVADNGGGVFVTGYSDRGDGSYDWATIKYSSSLAAAAWLDFQILNNQLVLSWTNSGFHLQAAPLVTGTYTNISSATNPYTNAFAGSQQYFRLQGD